MQQVDSLVIGGGVIGLAVARRFVLAGVETLALEREAVHGSHTSSRNSEVIHAGLYYAPGSLKALLCVRGREQLYDYCEDRGIEYRRCGKLIVATSDEEHPLLQHYFETARPNGVTDLAWLTPTEVAGLEPAVRCTAALWSPSTGIVSSHQLMQALLGDLESRGGALACRATVIGASLGRGLHRVAVQQEGTHSEFTTRQLVNAAGLDAQSVAHTFAGLDAGTIPARHLAKGHYFTLQGRARFGPDLEWVTRVDYAIDDA